MKICHIDELGKRKNPREVIESEKNVGVEQAYLKLPGKNLMNVSLEGSNKLGSVTFSGEKIRKILEKYGKKKYSDLHTHCKRKFCAAFPDYRDIKNFLTHDNVKTMFIAQTNKHTGRVEGYFVLRKTKSYEKRNVEDIEEDTEIYGSELSYGKVLPALKELAKVYNLKFRHIPAKGYELDAKNLFSSFRFVKKEKLEKMVTLIIFFSFISSIFFSSLNLTGLTISNLSLNISNLIGLGLFVLGLIGIFILKFLK